MDEKVEELEEEKKSIEEEEQKLILGAEMEDEIGSMTSSQDSIPPIISQLLDKK